MKKTIIVKRYIFDDEYLKKLLGIEGDIEDVSYNENTGRIRINSVIDEEKKEDDLDE